MQVERSTPQTSISSPSTSLCSKRNFHQTRRLKAPSGVERATEDRERQRITAVTLKIEATNGIARDSVLH